MIVECKTCGAPLDVVRGSAFAKCSYCGTTSKVKSAKTLLAETPAGWQPPATWKPPVVPRVAAPPPRRSANAAGCVTPMIVGAIVVGVGAFVAYQSGALTGLPYVGLALDGAPSVATVDLAAAPSAPLRATADGDYAASSLGSDCRGQLPRTPQFVLRTATGAAVRVAARDTSADLVMAIRTSEGRWLCDDDSGGGTQPLVTATLPAGDHRVFVGLFSSGAPSDFTLAIEAQTGVAITGRDAPAGLLPDAAPQIGEVQLGEAPLDGRWRGSTSGWTEARQVHSSCPGHLPAAPHLRIHASAPREIELITRADANADLVMFVQGPDGAVLCDDDSGEGLDPRIRARLVPGATNVWVGVYSPPNGAATFELELDASVVRGAGAELALEPRQGTLNLDVPGGVTRYEGTVSAEIPITDVGVSCRGRMSRRHDLVVLTSAPREMTLRARGARGLRLVVRGPDGRAVCADDDGGPALRHTFMPGTTHVWVGTGGASRPRYTLTLEP